MNLSELKKQIGNYNDYDMITICLKTLNNHNKGFPWDYNFCRAVTKGRKPDVFHKCPDREWQGYTEINSKQLDNIIRYPLKKFSYERHFVEQTNVEKNLWILFQ